MKVHHLKAILPLLCGLTLAACGGGGDDGDTPNPLPPGPTQLFSTNGDVSKYLGTWRSGCGLVISGAQSNYVRNVFTVTAVAADTFTVKLDTYLYASSDTACAASKSAPDTSVTAAVKYAKSVPVGGNTFTGNLDHLTYTASDTTGNYYAGFDSNFATFRLALDAAISNQNQIYTKQ